MPVHTPENLRLKRHTLHGLLLPCPAHISHNLAQWNNVMGQTVEKHKKKYLGRVTRHEWTFGSYISKCNYQFHASFGVSVKIVVLLFSLLSVSCLTDCSCNQWSSFCVSKGKKYLKMQQYYFLETKRMLLTAHLDLHDPRSENLRFLLCDLWPLWHHGSYFPYIKLNGSAWHPWQPGMWSSWQQMLCCFGKKKVKLWAGTRGWWHQYALCRCTRDQQQKKSMLVKMEGTRNSVRHIKDFFEMFTMICNFLPKFEGLVFVSWWTGVRGGGPPTTKAFN